jgi:oxygen-independent coproporphyrinogen-3 oxidase
MKHKKSYVQAVIRELKLRKDYLGGEPLETIYFGGGTPSQLQVEDYQPVFETIRQTYRMTDSPEITLEANPDDLSYEYLAALHTLPFNRISMGVQSFRDEDLLMLNRRHDARQAIDAIHRCREEGYTNLSLDLIYGLPGQTVEEWEANLDEAIRLQAPHLSAYHLSYEEGTAIHQQLKTGAIRPVDEETSVLLFRTLIYKLTAVGYLHYEISNFCRPDCFSRHNSAYWTGKKYLGIGPAAHSYDICSRQWNAASLPDYINGLAHGSLSFEKEYLDVKTRYNDYIITRLRTMWGIELSSLHELFGTELSEYFLQQAEPYIQKGLMQKTAQNIKITKDGLFISDGILCDLMRN